MSGCGNARSAAPSRLIVDHRVRQTTLILKVEVRPIPEFVDRMRRKELRRRPFGCRFPCDSFDSVLAELKRRGMLRIGLGAARAIEPVRLVHVEETASLFYDSLLTTNGICNSFQGTPARRRTFVLTDTRNIVLAH